MRKAAPWLQAPVTSDLLSIASRKKNGNVHLLSDTRALKFSNEQRKLVLSFCLMSAMNNELVRVDWFIVGGGAGTSLNGHELNYSCRCCTWS